MLEVPFITNVFKPSGANREVVLLGNESDRGEGPGDLDGVEREERADMEAGLCFFSDGSWVRGTEGDRDGSCIARKVRPARPDHPKPTCFYYSENTLRP